MAARIKDVASIAGVSTATVSHVINNSKNVSDEMKKRVHDAMTQLNYTPNTVARSLRSRKSNIIGLIIPIKENDNSKHYFMTVANGIESVLKKNGYHLLLSNSGEDYEEEMERIKVFNTQMIDGLIIAPTTRTDGAPEEERRFGDYPVVFIDRKPQHIQGDCVLVNGLEESYRAVSALIAKGHTRIGFISGKRHITSVEERLLGYIKALQDHGLKADDSLIRSGESKWNAGYDLAGELIRGQGVTALFVANNVMCMGSVKYLQENKIRIPDQMALIAFDDFEWTEVIDPPISVVRQPAYELGVKAAEILLSRIETPNKKAKEYRLAAELVVRHSF